MAEILCLLCSVTNEGLHQACKDAVVVKKGCTKSKKRSDSRLQWRCASYLHLAAAAEHNGDVDRVDVSRITAWKISDTCPWSVHESRRNLQHRAPLGDVHPSKALHLCSNLDLDLEL